MESWGYPVVLTSTLTGRGLQELERQLGSTTAVLAGPSGAGKSSIINALARAARERPSDASVSNVPEEQVVGEVSAKLGRGRHTTRTVALLPLGAGAVVDTPGFNQPDVQGLEPSELAGYFPEMRQATVEQGLRCGFSNCRHLSEPRCALRDLPGFRRYPIYVQLYQECETASREVAARVLKRSLRQSNVRKKMRAGGRVALEAKLDSKSHRRESRRSLNQKLQDIMLDESPLPRQH